MSASRPQSIARGFSINMAGRVAAAALGLLQLVVLAQVFGASAPTDAWYAALQVPMLLLVFLTGPLHTSFLPIYAERREHHDEADTQAFVRATFTAVIPLLALASALLWLAAPAIVRVIVPRFDAERVALAVTILRWLAPLPLVTGLAEFPKMLFLAHRSYTLPAIGSLFYATGVVVATIWLGGRHGIAVAAMGGVVAVAAEAVLLRVMLTSDLPRLRFTGTWRHSGVKQLFHLLWPRFISVGGNRMNLFVDNMFASALETGLLAALSFGEKLTRIPLILFAGPLSRTIMPVLSDYAARGDMDEIKRMLTRYLRMAAVLACGAGTVFVFFPVETVRVFYGRGAFDDAAVQATSVALLCYGLGMVAYAFRMLISLVFFAVQDTRTPMRWALIGVVVNAAADWLFMGWLGHAGIALATALVETVIAAGLYRDLSRRIGGMEDRETAAVLAKCVFGAGILGGLAWLAARLILEPMLGPPGFWRDLLLVAACAGPAGVAYLYLLHRSGVEEVRQVVGFLARRGRR